MILAPKAPTALPVTEQCPAGCTLSETIACWIRRERELRRDLAASRGSDDAEVLAADLRDAERRIDALIAAGLAASRRPSLRERVRLSEGRWAS